MEYICPRLNATRFGPACQQIADSTFDKEQEKIRQAADMWNVKVKYGRGGVFSKS